MKPKNKLQKNLDAVGLGKLGGAKRLEKGGREVFKDMAKKSWERPSAKRQAMNIIRAATRTLIAAKKEEMKDWKLVCEECDKPLDDIRKDAHFQHTNYNQPWSLVIICAACRKKWGRKHTVVKLTEENAQKIVKEAEVTEGQKAMKSMEIVMKAIRPIASM